MTKTKQRQQKIKHQRMFFQVTATAMAIMVIVSGVAFAGLQSQQNVLKGNTVQTLSANLQISTNGSDYKTITDGYNFTDLYPGGQALPVPGYPLYVKNVGSTALITNMKLGITPIASNVNLAKVHLLIKNVVSGEVQDVTLQDLTMPGGVALNQGNRILAGATLQLNLKVSMEADAVIGSSATLSNLDFTFDATSIN